MKPIFNINDIINIIYKNLFCIWDGRHDDINRTSAKPEDFLKIPMDRQDLTGIPLVVYSLNQPENKNKRSINIRVNDYDFKISYGDNVHEDLFFCSYQESWMELLLNSHFEEYAHIYISVYEKKCRELEKKYPLTGIFKKKRKMNESDSSNYKKYLEKIENAKSRLNENNFSV